MKVKIWLINEGENLPGDDNNPRLQRMGLLAYEVSKLDGVEVVWWQSTFNHYQKKFRWHEASTYLPLICLNSTLYPLHAINLNMLQVQGRSDLFLGLEVVKKLIGLIPLVVCVFWGIMPMLCVNLAVGVVAYLLNSYYSGRLIGYNSWMQVKDIVPSCLVAAIVAVSVYFVKYLPVSYWVILPLQIIMGAVVFMVLCQLTRNPEYIVMKTMLAPYLRKVNSEQ